MHPIAEWAASGRRGPPADQRLADLEPLDHRPGPGRYAPLIAPLVDVSLPPEARPNFAPEDAAPAAGALSPGSGGRAVEAGRARLRGPALGGPDLARSHAGAGRARRAGAAVHRRTTRPEFRPPWSARPHHSVIALAPLDRAQVARMVGESPRACAVEGHRRRGERAHRRRAAVRRGGDAAPAWSAASRAARGRSRRPCSSRSPRGSTGWARRGRSRRSALCSGATSRMR